MIGLVALVGGTGVYYFETRSETQQFSSLAEALWWSVVTLTTIGYGDVVPITNLGKLLAGGLSLLSIGLLALPAGIISSGFIERIHRTKKCPHCGKDIESHN